MAEEATQTEQKTVVINGEEHNVADLSREQIGLLNQVVDLDGKIGQMSFNLAQAQAAKGFFMAQLNASLEQADPEEDGSDSGETRDVVTVVKGETIVNPDYAAWKAAWDAVDADLN